MKKILRRLITHLLCIAMLVSVIPVPASAAESPVIEVQSVRAVPGGSADVEIRMKNNPGIGVAVLKVSFDESILTLDSFQYGPDYQKDGENPPNLKSPLTLTWSTGTANVSGSHVYATLHFTVSENVQSDTNTEVKIDSCDTYDIDEREVDFQIQNGIIEIKMGIPGDINSDGVCDARDLLRMRKYFAGWDVAVDMVAADVTGDGSVNAVDLLRLRKYFAGWDVEIHYGSNVMSACAHNMIATPAKAATCTEAGNIAYWLCSKCLKYFSDSKGQNEVQSTALTVPAKGHTIVTDPAVEPTYTAEGKTEGSHCSVCGLVIVAQESVPKLKKTEYSITYNIVGNDNYLASQNIEMPAANVGKFSSDQEVIFEDLSCPGYIFKGWYDAYGNPMPKIEKGTERNITVYAKWEAQPYSVVFNYDNELSGLVNTARLENFTYKVNATSSLPVLSLAGYTFIGWSDEDGNLCTQIKKGSTGEKQFYANWISDRSKAWAAKEIGEPVVYEDDSTILFTYEIGRIENVPIYTIEDFGKINAGGVSQSYTKQVSAQMSESLVNAYSSAVEKSTTGNATWTLSNGWTDSISIDREWAEANGMTTEQAREKSTSETGNWFVNTTRGGSSTRSTTDSTDTYDLKTTTSNKKTYGSSESTQYGSKTTEAGWNVNGSLEFGAKETIATSGVIKKLGADGSVETTQKLNISGGYEHKNTDKSGKDTLTRSGTDDESGSGSQTGSVSNHSSSSSSTSSWSNESGFGGSTTNASSERIAQAISRTISEKTGYGESYLKTGSSSETQGLSSTNANKDTFSSQVTYSKLTQETTTVSYSTDTTVTGWHRWVMAATAHVFGIVGYDKAKGSYFTTT